MQESHWLSEQINRFKWHCTTHIFETAKVLSQHFQNNTPPLNNSGFFILCGVMPYIEGVGQHLVGGDKDTSFKNGFKDIFEQSLGQECEELEKLLWKRVRHGLFHDATVRGPICLSRRFPKALAIADGQLDINPHLLVCDLESHLQRYTRRLEDTAEVELREKFTNCRKKLEESFVGESAETLTTSGPTCTPNPNDSRYSPGSYDANGCLSGLWLALVTPDSFEVGRHLIEGLKNPTVVLDKSALDAFPVRPMSVKDAIQKAITNRNE